MDGEKKSKGHDMRAMSHGIRSKSAHTDDFVLEKSIFSNIFEKDIKRIYIYKKAERLAKAIHLVTPAFADTASLRNRMDSVAIGLVDAAIQPPSVARTALSRELLALSSVLSIARTGGLLSPMNAELIAREAQHLLQEVAAYEEPRLFLDEAPTLADIARRAGKADTGRSSTPQAQKAPAHPRASATKSIGQVKDIDSAKDNHIKDRQEAILSVLRRNGGSASIKDISTIIRNVSEKTIQRELAALVKGGAVEKKGERRWSTYYIV